MQKRNFLLKTGTSELRVKSIKLLGKYNINFKILKAKISKV